MSKLLVDINKLETRVIELEHEIAQTIKMISWMCKRLEKLETPSNNKLESYKSYATIFK